MMCCRVLSCMQCIVPGTYQSSSGSSQNSTPKPSASLPFSSSLSQLYEQLAEIIPLLLVMSSQEVTSNVFCHWLHPGLDSAGHARVGFSSHNNFAPCHCQHHLKSKHDSLLVCVPVCKVNAFSITTYMVMVKMILWRRLPENDENLISAI